ncbi:MAG: MTH938/NDUFAF3 family protein [Hyphomicrobiales bacterium]
MREAHFPGRSPIDAYGNGGFRFAEMSHQGGILALPSGIYGWSANTPADVTIDRMNQVVAEASDIELLFLGMGDTGQFPTKETRLALKDAGVRFEIMSTGAAIRTFNVILGEGRAVAAALLPVETVR